MASSSASMAASKLFNATTPALQSLIRRHLIRPSATQFSRSTDQDARLFNLAQIDGEISDPIRNSVNSRDLDLGASNFPMKLRMPFNSALPRIELARTYVPKIAEDEFDDDEDDDDDDEDIEDFDGSDFDDEDIEDFRPRKYKE